jgi:hypothetical protein
MDGTVGILTAGGEECGEQLFAYLQLRKLKKMETVLRAASKKSLFNKLC